MGELIYRRAGVGEIYGLRVGVLRPKLVAMTLAFEGDRELGTWHVGAFENGVNVGCLTLLMSEWEGEKSYQLRGMAVAEGFRGKGVGMRLLEKAREMVAEVEGVAGMAWWCNARVEAVGFYEKAGWVVVSEEFVIEQVGPHRKMVRRWI